MLHIPKNLIIFGSIKQIKKVGMRRMNINANFKALRVLILFSMVLFANVEVSGQLTITHVEDVSITCFGGSATITITATGGTQSGLEYSVNGGTDWYSSNVFAGLPGGPITISARDDGPNTGEESFSISEPSEVSLSVVQTSPNNCDGEIEVTISGGTPPYDLNSAFGSENGTGPYTYTGLDDQLYSFTVTDLNGCSPSGGAVEYTVQIDQAAPTVVDGTFPDTFESSLLDFSSGLSSGVSIPVYATSFTLESGNLEQILIDGDYSFYNTLHYSFDVNQTNGPAVAGDQLSVMISFNNGSSFSPVNVYSGVISGVQTGSISLNSDPNQNTQVIVKLVATIVTSGLQYEISSCAITGDEQFNKNAIDDATGGFPTYDDDVSGPDFATLVTNTSAPTYYCASGDEFTFTRSWTVSDFCSHELNTADQLIRVGDPPTINMAANGAITIDSCYRATQNITPPTASDNCSESGNITITWVIHDSSGDTPGSGNITYTFLPGEQTTIDWIATDEAGFSTTETQTVDVLPGIFATFIADPTDICLGGSVTFTLTVSGGTGSYSVYDFTPSGGNWANPDYTTTELPLGASSLEVIITDGDFNGVTGGCFSTLTSGAVNVHELVQTPSITRD